MFLTLLLILVTVKSSIPVFNGPKIHLRGRAASFPLRVYRNWMWVYTLNSCEHRNVTISYEVANSNWGKCSVLNSCSVPNKHPYLFGGTDLPLTPERYRRYPEMKMLPTLAGYVIVVYLSLHFEDIEHRWF